MSSPFDAPHQTYNYQISDLVRRIVAIETVLARMSAEGAVDLVTRERVTTIEASLITINGEIDGVQENIIDLDASVNAIDTRLSIAEGTLTDHETRISALENP